MPSADALQEEYQRLTGRYDVSPSDTIDSDCLLTFDYEYSGRDIEIVVDSQEFTAVCPWSGLPDFGIITICYVPDLLCVELKSLKYYLYTYSGVGIVQEHAANRILDDLVLACKPSQMKLTLDYNVRGGIHCAVTVKYEKP